MQSLEFYNDQLNDHCAENIESIVNSNLKHQNEKAWMHSLRKVVKATKKLFLGFASINMGKNKLTDKFVFKIYESLFQNQYLRV